MDFKCPYSLQAERKMVQFQNIKKSSLPPFFSLSAITTAKYSLKELRLYFPLLERGDTIFLKGTYISKIEA